MTRKGAGGPPAGEEDHGDGRVYDQMKTFAVPSRARQTPKLAQDDLDARATATKAWSTYKLREARTKDKRMLELTAARDNALDELKAIDMKRCVARV
jgi:hypothetical protein